MSDKDTQKEMSADEFEDFVSSYIEELETSHRIVTVNNKIYMITTMTSSRSTYTIEIVQLNKKTVNIVVDRVVYQISTKELYDRQYEFLKYLSEDNIRAEYTYEDLMNIKIAERRHKHGRF